jgi:hypothetical protein
MCASVRMKGKEPRKHVSGRAAQTREGGVCMYRNSLGSRSHRLLCVGDVHGEKEMRREQCAS